MRSREHRRWRQRRRPGKGDEHTYPESESEDLVAFARMWAPYGGATEEEILVNFGMTPDRFLERLLQILLHSNFTQEETTRLTNVQVL